MSCFYCYQQNMRIASQGTCPCGLDVCTAPPKRPDKQFHGEQCKCGCGVLVCEAHISQHSQTEHGGLPSCCFPALTTHIAGETVVATLEILERGSAGKADLDRVHRFLNTLAPGSRTLHEIVTAREVPNEGIYSVKVQMDAPYLEFAKEFYQDRTVGRILALATRELGNACERNKEAKLTAIRTLGPRRARALDAFVAMPGLAWAGTQRLKRVWKLEPDLSERLMDLHGRLGLETIPTEGRQLGKWLLAERLGDDSESAGAPALGETV